MTSKIDIIRSYKELRSTRKVATLLGVSRSKVQNVVREEGIIRKSGDRSSFDKIFTKELLERLYLLEKRSLPKIGKLYDTDHHTVKRYLVKYGIKQRIIVRYKVNENFFINQSSDMAYILGFITADGCIKNNSFTFCLQDTDRVVLDYIIASLSYTGPIRLYKKKKSPHKTMATIAIHQKKLVQDLRLFGLHERKTGLENFPELLKEEFYPDYLRGLFDGDGSIQHIKRGGTSKSKRSWCLVSASRTFLEDINLKILSNICTINECVNKKTKRKYFYLYASNKKNLEKIFRTLYSNSTSFSLNRKYLKFKGCIDEIQRYPLSINNKSI